MTDKTKIDVAAAKKLADEISVTLDSLPRGGKHAALRAEVDELKAMLSGTGTAAPDIQVKMKSVQSSLDGAALELQSDGIRVGVFLRDIGKMLGLD
jgi:hypothetical protein